VEVIFKSIKIVQIIAASSDIILPSPNIAASSVIILPRPLIIFLWCG